MRPNDAPDDVDDRFGYDPTTGTYHARTDWEDEQITTAIVRTVAAVTNEEPTDIEPLYEEVDPDALERFLQVARRGEARDRTIRFTLEGRAVAVEADGAICVQCDA